MTIATAPEPPPQVLAPARRQSSFLKNVTSSWVSLLANIILSFFLAPFIVRSLGNVYYGIWTLVMQFTGYLWLFDFGVRESVVKYVAQYHASDDREELVSTVQAAVTLYALIGAAALLMCVGMVLALPYIFNIPPDAVPTAQLTLLITGATVAQGFVFNVYIGVLMGIQRYYLVARMGTAVTLIRSALIFGLLLAGYGIVAFAVVHFVLSFGMSLLVYRLAMKHMPHLKPRLVRPRRDQLRRIVGYGKFVLVTNIGEKLVYASDSLVIGIFMPVSTLTYYAVAGSLVGYLKSFVATMAVVLNPMSSALEAKKDPAGLRRLFLTSSKGAVVVGLPVCIGFVVLGERFINIWMGPEFGPISAPLLAVLAVAHFVGMPYHTMTGVLLGLGKHRITAYARIFEAIANVAISVVLVQRLGLIGVAIGTLVPHAIVVLVILPSVIPKLLSIRLVDYFTSTYMWPLAASVPFGAVCVAIDRVAAPQNLVSFMALVAPATLAYAVPCWFLALSTDERRWALEKVGKVRRR